MKRLKTDSEVKPKLDLLKVSESKKEIKVPVQHSGTVIGSTEKTRCIELKQNIFADTINIRAQVPQCQEISLEKQRQAERIALEEVKKTVHFEHAMEIEGCYMKLFGRSRGGIDKIRIPTASHKTSMAANKITTTTPQQDRKVLEWNAAITQINKVVHGSQSPTSVLEKERETARNAIEKMEKTVHFEHAMEIEENFMKLIGCSRDGKEKINSLVEDLEEGEIRIPTVSL